MKSLSPPTLRTTFGRLCILGWLATGGTLGTVTGGTEQLAATASSAVPGFSAPGAVDGDRFLVESNHAWQGSEGAGNWWWQVRFDPPRKVGAILQIVGDHPFVLRNAPRDYVWQWSADGTSWTDLPSTRTQSEQRTYRLHRLPAARRIGHLRLEITSVSGSRPTVREVEFLRGRNDALAFPDWIVAVNTTHDSHVPGAGQEFIPLARSCPGWEKTQAQQVWLREFDEAFVKTEPRPLCAFLSGNFKDWCEVNRELWRGTQEVLDKKNLPIWASCGGAQGLAILSEVGVDQPWDCPHCRDARAPKSPIYTHIGHTGSRPCGDYSQCIYERGPTRMRLVADDPAFRGLPAEFEAMESHCGQIQWPPNGWRLVACGGQGAKTRTQCLRVNDRYIYAAQFHIEMDGTQENSRRIMGNFLGLAKQWGGWNPKGRINEKN